LLFYEDLFTKYNFEESKEEYRIIDHLKDVALIDHNKLDIS
jgi:hypothetical protein